MRSKSFFIRLLALFIVFFITPIILISSTLSFAVSSSFKDEVSEASLNELSVIKNTVEIALNGVVESALMVSVNKELNRLVNMNYETSIRDSDSIFIIKGITDELSNLEKLNDRIHSIYLYNEEAETVHSSFQRYSKASEFDDMEWLSAYKSNHDQSWIRTRDITSTRERAEFTISKYTKVITFVTKLSPYTTKLKGSVVINIYEDRLYKLMSNKVEDNKKNILVLDDEGYVISSDKKDLIGKNLSNEGYIEKAYEEKQDHGYYIVDIDGESNLITFSKSDLNGWTYISLSNLNESMTRVRTLGIYMFILSFILILLGSALAYLVSQRLYSPVRQMIENIQAHKGINIDESKDEMAYVSNAINEVLTETDELRDLIEKRNRNSRNNTIKSLLNGNVNSSVDMKSLGISFDKDGFLCVLVAIDKYGSFSMKNEHEQQIYLKSVVLKVFEEMFGSEWKAVGALMEKGEIGVIINLNSDEDAKEYEEVINKVELFISTIANTMDFTVSASIGEVYKSIDQVDKSFLEATEALKYRLQYGDTCVIVYRKVMDEINRTYYYPDKKEIHLINYLKAGQRQELLNTIEAYTAEVKEMKLSYDNTIQIFNQLLGNIIKFLISIGVKPNEVFGGNTTLYKHLSGLETIEDIRLWLNNTFICIMEYLQANKDNDMNYIDKAKEYINENYKYDFDVNSVVEYVGISYTHLRRVFAEELGMSINSYINQLRIEDAKRLLKGTDKSIDEIASIVGYHNNQSLNRFFKKMEGITPGAYRKIEG